MRGKQATQRIVRARAALKQQQKEQRFLESLQTKPVGTASELYARAKKKGLKKCRVYTITRAIGLRLTTRHTLVEAKISGRKQKARLKKLFEIMPRYEALFRDWANPYVKLGIPFDLLYDCALDAAMRGLDRFDPNHESKASFKTWVTNSWKNGLKEAMRVWAIEQRRSKNLGDLCLYLARSREPRPEESVISAEMRGRLHKALSQLPPTELVAVTMQFGIGVEPKPLEQIAPILGITPQGVNLAKQRGLRKLRAILKHE